MDDVGFWAAAVASCALLAIWGRDERRMPLHWGFKPLPALILIPAVHALAPAGDTRMLVTVALGLSLAGDVLLMLPKKLFPLGLASFLCALVVYTVAFSIGVPWSPTQLSWLVLPVVPAALVLRTLWPHIGKLRPAIGVYVAAVTVLLWRMLARFGEVSPAAYWLGVVGGASFMAADSLLALRRFAGWKVPYALELGPYFVAQWCLASSTWH